MKLNGANNYNVLPFYSSKEYWHSKRWYTYGQICPVAARKDYLVPFQLYFTRDVVFTSGNITLDIKRVNDDVTVKSFTLNHSFIHTPEYVIIKFPEQQITALPLGLYYYKVTYQETDDSGVAQGEPLEAYSDILSVMEDESNFVRLEYWNASDIITNGYTISFADNFKFVSYIHSTIAKPDYEFEEELTKRLGYKFIETQVSTKVYKFNYLATEANCDAMRIARMCDYIKFTTSLDVYNALYMSFEVAWQDYGDVANLTVEFETDTIIQRLESFKRSDVANFYNALLYNINEPILFDYDTIAQYYSDFSGQGKMIRELDQITVDDITPASTMPIDLGQGAAKKIAIEEIFSKYSAFNEYFGFDEVNNAVYVKGNRSFYTMPLGDIIAGGYDESPGSVVKVERLTDIGDVRPDSLNANDLLKYDGTNWVTIPLASISSKIDKLTDINDVTPINLTAGDLLKYDGSKWVNIPMASISGKVEGITVNNSNYYPEPTTKLITLPNYPTTLPASDVYSWAKQPNKPSYSFSELSSHPTTLGGYGITDAYTKTDADSRYFRHIGDTYEDGRNTGWIGFGTGTYIEAYPDGIAHKIYPYGQVTSFNSSYSSLELYSTHTSSDPNDGNNGIQFRSGWNDDKKSWRMLLDEVNYLYYTDNRYVNKAGDTMTGNLVFAHASERPSYSGSIGITFREQIANGQGVKLVYNDYDNYRAPAGLILVGEQGGEYFEAPAIYQNGYKVWDAGNKRDMFSSMNEAFTTWGNEQVINVEGDANTYYPVVITIDDTKTWNSRISIHKNLGSRTPSYPGNHGNGTSSMWAMYEGRYNGWDGNNGYIVTKYVSQPYANLISKAELAGSSVGALVVYLRGGGCEYRVCTDYRRGVNVYYERTEISGYSEYPVYVEPTTSVGNQGVLNTVSYDYIVQKAVRLGTPRYIFSKPFDGTGNVTGGAKFNAICIETDNNGNDSGRISEINNYNSELHLQFNTSRNITMCMGGGNVVIGTGPLNGHRLNVNGNVGIDGAIYFMGLSGGNERNLLYQQMADNDMFRIRCGGPSNQGWVEIATADDGTEPIYVRQYTGEFSSVTRTLTLLDGSGNTHVPGNFYATGEVAAGSASDLRLKEIQKRPSYANRLLKMGLVRDYYFNDLAKSRDVRKVDNDLHTGMIYQDVLPVLSSMCGVDDDGYGKLNYIKPDFICTIAGATQDNTISLIKVNTRMSKLETAIRHLKRKINKLERKLSYEQASIQ